MRASARTYAVFAVGVGVLVLVAVLRFGGGAGTVEVFGLPTAGPVTDWGLPLARLALDLCAVACVGTLLAASVLAPGGSPESARCLRAAGWWALGWAVAALAGYVFTLSSFIPMPVASLLAEPGMLDFGTSLPQTQALLVVLVTTFAVAVATLVRRLPAWVPLAVAAFGLLPPAYVGHAASAADHDIAVSALMAHLLGVSVWVGGLGAVLLHFRRSADLRVVLPRFSTIALCCFAAVALSGLVSAWVRLDTLSDLWLSRYGLLLLAKVAALAVLAWFGRRHRLRTVEGVADRRVRRTFVRLAAGEVTVMVAATGLAVGLSRTPPPPGAGGGHDHPVLEYALAPFSPGALLSEVRLDPLVLLLLALPAAGYLTGLRRVPGWPVLRTLSWHAGLALAAVALVGGVGGYARAMSSAQAVQHVVLAVVAPLLLCAGAPLTLAARATGPGSQYGPLGERALGRRLTRPAFLTAAVPLLLLLLYGTAWLPWSLAGYAPHLVTMAVSAGVGLLVAWAVLDLDPLPRPFPWAARVRLLAVAGVAYLGLGTYLLVGPAVAADWFSLAAPPGVPDPLADQRVAGAVFLLVPLAAFAFPAVRLALRRQAARAWNPRGVLHSSPMGDLPVYDVVLLPPHDVNAQAVRLSRRCAEATATEFVLREDDLYPHISLYMANFTPDRLKEAVALLHDLSRRTSAMSLEGESFAANDHGMVELFFRKTDAITRLQQDVVTALNPLRTGLRRRDPVGRVLADHRLTAPPTARANLDLYGYDEIGDLFRPHITLTRLQQPDHSLDLGLLAEPSAFTATYPALALCVMGEHGTCTEIVETFTLDTAPVTPTA
ncbi:bifunctional copper resistance protein CopD/cytochrome c oxidase assembly protein [Nonomuraea sp. NPDC052265]|uniref:bifunctional copper resistance protein CopD/cytochrome c oxidase assembly protein n=1 Tax=Nonomuraea sp. NPDC052265 TaxID=3364374 RepID=UPI0037CA10D5